MLKRRLAMPLVGILLVAVVLAPIPGGTRWIGALHDTAHGPIFGCIAILLLFAMRQWAGAGRWRPWTLYAAAFLGSALLGIATELVQIPVGRDATFSDAALDVLGALGFLVLFAAVDPVLQQGRGSGSRIMLVLVALPLLYVVVSPGVDAAAAYARRADRFPVLADFSAHLDDYFIHPNWSLVTLASAAPEYAQFDGERALRVQFQPGPYTGLDFPEPAPDWSGYTTLALDITNPHASPLELLLRVHDASHTNYEEDRFNKVLHVAPRTRATLRVALEEIRSAPQGRTMDMRRIADLLFFRTDASPAVPDIYVTRIWLE